MRKLILGLVGATALTMAAGANATVVDVEGIDSALLNSNLSESFSATVTGQAQGSGFSQGFEFTLFSDFLANSSVTTTLLGNTDLDFTSITLDGWNFTQVLADGVGPETWTLTPPINLAAGTYTLTVTGTVAGTSGGGGFGGDINLTSPVPEPGTWAMMLLGFGAVGFAMRRRRAPALAQIA